NNDFREAVSLTGAETKIVDKDALTLGALATGNLTASSTGTLNLGQGSVGGALVAGSNGGGIAESGVLSANSLTATSGGGVIVLTQRNAIGEVSLDSGGGAITYASASGFGLTLANQGGRGSVDVDVGGGALALRNTGFGGASLAIASASAVSSPSSANRSFVVDPASRSIDVNLAAGPTNSVALAFRRVLQVTSPRTFNYNGVLWANIAFAEQAGGSAFVLPAVARDQAQAQRVAAGIGSVEARLRRNELTFEEIQAPVAYEDLRAMQAECSAEQAEGQIGAACKKSAPQ
ncbi:MAG: hypothetical protein ACK5RK_01675, partial [Betaproteobacteria bacterium]